MGHHNQLSLYCHLLTETSSRNIWDCCFPQKSSSCHYSPAPAVLTNPKATDSATSWGHQSSLHPQGLCPHQLWLLLELVLQGEGGSICYCCSHHLPSPFTPADFLNLTLFLHSSDKKLFPSNVLDTAGRVPLLFCNTHNSGRMDAMKKKRYLLQGRAFLLRKIITK